MNLKTALNQRWMVTQSSWTECRATSPHSSSSFTFIESFGLLCAYLALGPINSYLKHHLLVGELYIANQWCGQLRTITHHVSLSHLDLWSWLVIVNSSGPWCFMSSLALDWPCAVSGNGYLIIDCHGLCLGTRSISELTLLQKPFGCNRKRYQHCADSACWHLGH